MNNMRINKNLSDISHSVRKIRVEEEGLFPDYCSDIVRIVSVSATPTLTDKKFRAEEDSIGIETSGKVDFTVIYSGEDGGCEAHSFSCNFTENMKNPLSGDIDSDSITLHVIPYIENLSCKVQSPRKVSVRCDIVLDTLTRGNTMFEAVNTDLSDEKKTEIMKSEVSLCTLLSSASDSFDFSEEIKLPSSLPPMERILSCVPAVSLENTSVGANSVSFWGTLGIHCTYLPESDGEREVSVQSFYQPMEISERIECGDAESSSAAMGELVVSGVSFEILTDNLGDNRILKVNGSYTANFDIIENEDTVLARDLYGVGCEADLTEETKRLLKFEGTLKENTAIRETISLKEDIIRLEGCRGEIKLSRWGYDNGKMYADYKMDITAIGCTEDGERGVRETVNLNVPFNLPTDLSVSDKSLVPVISASVGYIDSKVTSGKAELSFDLVTTAHIFSESEESYVSSVTLTEKEKTDEFEVFCYPSSEDTLWSVGKRYGVSLSALAEANSITDGTLKRVIRIP
ncbi:MAG: DUF3794 domain-containing protein [Clostridia bacterium]|nr:DUF3794 domain-containing protein [Clostridia bacterium]